MKLTPHNPHLLKKQTRRPSLYYVQKGTTLKDLILSNKGQIFAKNDAIDIEQQDYEHEKTV